MYDDFRPGIEEESSALREPSFNRGPKRVGFCVWTDLERIAQPRFGGPPNIFFSSQKWTKLFWQFYYMSKCGLNVSGL